MFFCLKLFKIKVKCNFLFSLENKVVDDVKPNVKMYTTSGKIDIMLKKSVDKSGRSV